MISGCNCLMKWIGNLMTWLDCGIGFLWTCDIYMCWFIRSMKEMKNFPRFTSVIEHVFCNCSVPGRLATPRQVQDTWRKHCCPFFTYNCRSTRPWPGRLGIQEDVDLLPAGWQGSTCRRSTGQGPGRPDQLWKPFFQGFFSPCLEDFRWDFGYPF